ncbi:tRNA (guanosine(37)-N1)-methyltransferase TrmD [Egicoccus sp. AB-alg2]|uniref:tRNA (guanosine(37)-N1)-methyltransferase TrmD n=1 Tax=Egicoccus sp. AB-alg2 TaxID=3242693 RepID=UPI00359CF639
MRIDVLTIFPDWFQGPLTTSLLGKAHAAGTLDLRVHDLRSFTTDRHRTVDDAPYGGGAGMVMRPDVWVNAAESVWNDLPPEATAGGTDAPAGATHVAGGARPRTLLLTPRGRPLTQAYARDLAGEPRLVLCCGRYEGIDERVHDLVATDEVSIGDYVLFGGEVAAAVVIEAVTRLVPGVMGNAASPEDESFSSGLLEYPHYTRPPVLRGHGVPPVLTSGDHGAVERWRHEQALALTRERRPDLLEDGRAEPAGDPGGRPPAG